MATGTGTTTPGSGTIPEACPAGSCTWAYDGKVWTATSNCTAGCNCFDPTGVATHAPVVHPSGRVTPSISLAEFKAAVQKIIDDGAHVHLVTFKPATAGAATTFPPAHYADGDEYTMPCYK